MPNFAVIQNNIVENVIVADSKEAAEGVVGKLCVEYTEENPASIGFVWNGSTFEQPPAPAEEILVEETPITE